LNRQGFALHLALFAMGATLILLYALQAGACLLLEWFDEGQPCICTSGHLLRVLELASGAMLAAVGARAVKGS
jgi:hypothetical protein